MTRSWRVSETKSPLAESFIFTAGAVRDGPARWGGLLIDSGMGYDAAIARIAELRAGTRQAVDACPESPSQHRVLGERAARRRGS
jgi:hypothetical protein